MRERVRSFCLRVRSGRLRWFTFLFFLDLAIAAHGSRTRPLSGSERCARLVFFDWPFVREHQRAADPHKGIRLERWVPRERGLERLESRRLFAVVKFTNIFNFKIPRNAVTKITTIIALRNKLPL